MTFPLAVDIHQYFAQLFQQRHGNRLIVDVALAAALSLESAGDDQVGFAEFAFQDGLDRPPQLRAFEFEDPGDPQIVGPGANKFGRGPFAQQQSQGAQEQRLAGAGFTGPGAKAVAQLDPDILDQRQMMDGKFP